jgi:hypothetical protein
MVTIYIPYLGTSISCCKSDFKMIVCFYMCIESQGGDRREKKKNKQLLLSVGFFYNRYYKTNIRDTCHCD